LPEHFKSNILHVVAALLDWAVNVDDAQLGAVQAAMYFLIEFTLDREEKRACSKKFSLLTVVR
jgi:hypothetical protein